MDYGIGMFLTGLLSGVAIGWHVALIKNRIAYGDPKERMREAMYHKGLLYKAGVPMGGKLEI